MPYRTVIIQDEKMKKKESNKIKKSLSISDLNKCSGGSNAKRMDNWQYGIIYGDTSAIDEPRVQKRQKQSEGYVEISINNPE